MGASARCPAAPTGPPGFAARSRRSEGTEAGRYDPGMIRTAHIRVYLPARRFSGLRLPPHVADHPPVTSNRYGLLGESLVEDCYYADWRGSSYLCPRTPRLRVLEGVLAVRRSYRLLGGAALIPEEVAEAAREELTAIHRTRPGLRSHILTSAWHVPLRWLIPFDPAAKEVVERLDGPSVRYRVAHGVAMQRIDAAVGVLRRSDLPDSLAAEVGELRSWLVDFAGDALVELDYGTVAGMFGGVDLALDDSVAEAWASLDALDRGDWDEAAAHYAELASRWAAPTALSYSS